MRRGLAIVVDERHGLVEHVLAAADAPPDALRLSGALLAPGFVNVHSHAFQRDLRGAVERRAGHEREDSFWTWREEMYAHAAALDPERIRDVARRCFDQMRAAGYTAVGEFHYVHHRPDGTPYPSPNALAEAVCAAAEDAGLRIVLLLAAYERSAAGRGPTDAQRRFCDPTVEAYLERLSALEAWAAARPLVRVGAAPHSVRAVSAAWLERIAGHCADRGLVLHVHAGEQPREIEESLAEHGLRPVEVLDRVGALGGRTTVVHGTHCNDAEIDLIATRQASVCVCPSTEANLGDGYAPVGRLFDAGVAVCVGSDSNTIVDPLAELRSLETIARRTALRRNVLVRAGEPGPASYLLDCGWSAGARALGLTTPLIREGAPADLVALDLDNDEIAGVADEHLAAAIVFAGSAALVTRTWVGGRP